MIMQTAAHVLDIFVPLFVLLLTVPALSCPFPWVSRPGSKSCYYYGISVLMSWTEARDRCLSMEADLVRVDDPKEQRWLLSALKKQDDSLIGVQEWWTGLQRNPADQNTWVWADNSVANTSFLQWGQGEPNNFRNNEHCAEIWDRTFNDKTCSMPLNYVCERSKDIPAKCDSILYWEFHHGKCYRLYTTPVFKAQATEICRLDDADIVQIDDAGSETAITELAKSMNMHVWLSMSYMSKTMKWITIDRMDSETINNVFFWQSGEPTLYDGVDSCAALNSSAAPKRNWYTDNCTETKSFICQTSAGMCPPGFIKNEKRCYLFKASMRTSWAQARQYCENIGSSLLDINSAAENVFIINTVNRMDRRSLERLWIGLARNGDPNRGGRWRWMTKGGYFPATYVNVDPRQTGRSSCVYMDAGASGKWYSDLSCNDSLSFVCYTYHNMAEEERAVLPDNPRTTVATVTTRQTTKRIATTPRRVTTTTLPQSPPVTTRTVPKTIAPLTRKPPIAKITTKSANTTTKKTTTPSPDNGIIGSTHDPLCGPYWTHNPNSYYYDCYAQIESLVTWDDGRQLCKNLGGDLLSINTIEEQHFLTGKLKGYSKMWMGGSSRGEEGGWEWSDGSAFAYLNFLAGEPNIINGSDRCVAMSLPTKRWSDEFCNQRLGVLCKKRGLPPIPDVPLTSPPFVTGDKVYGCPPGWAEYRLSCFLIVRNKTSWGNALTTCRKEGADLASIKDEGEHSFILSQLPKSHCYNVFHTDDKCDKWAKSGECDKNPVWMAKNCQQSCGACIRDCKNTYFEAKHCDLWARVGECRKNHKWMLRNCAFSCGVCDPAIYGGFWIGLTDKQQYMTFRWTDHSPVKYTIWSKNEPNNMGRKGEDCVTMRLKDGKWNDYNCDEVMPGFVCKTHKKIIPRATVSPLSIGCVNDSLGYNAYCYSFNDEANSWTEAKDKCSENGGSLATINDRYVQAFVASQLGGKKKNYWIGLKQDYSSGAFEQWVSGQSVKFTHWSDSHTGGVDEDGFCVSLSTRHPIGLWDTVNCSVSLFSVCEYPRDGYSTTSLSTLPPYFTVTPNCASSWTEFGNYCYKKFGDKQSWSSASARCQQYGAELTSVHSIVEQQFLMKTFLQTFYQNTDAWIGLSDRSTEGGFSWSDGTPFDFTLWGPDEPNDGGLYQNEDCVAILDDTWFDDNCNMAKSFICSVEKGAPVIPERNVSLPFPETCSGDDDWLHLRAGGADLCFYFSNYDVSRTWYETLDFCNSLGGNLASITSQEILDFIMSQTSQDTTAGSFWIGLNDIKHQGFEWSDYSFLNFLNWDYAGRASSSGKCVYQWPNTGRWFVENCNAKFSRVVCQRTNGSTDAVTTPTPVVKQGGCPKGYTGSPVSNNCFKVLNGLYTQSEATTQCEVSVKNGFLATISSSQENDFITSLAWNVTGTGVWIGLSKTDSAFGWADNGRFQFENWYPGEPSGHMFLCAELFVNRAGIGKWNDVQCWKSRAAVCQAPKSPVFPTQSFSDSRCPTGYTFYGISCYKLNLAPLVRNAAAASCASESASLSSVTSEYEQAFLNVLMRDIEGSYWIGLQKKGSTFEWDNGWTYQYTKWDDNEPSDIQSESCVIIDSGKWNDITCNVKLPSVCQYSLVDPPTTPPPGICPNSTSGYQGYCYFVEITRSKSWVGADAACKEMGMELASVHSQAEVQFIQSYARQISGLQVSPKLWIGLRKDLDASAFEWTDDTPLDFLFWEDGEPSDVWEEEDEDCVEMYAHGKWNDVNCNDYNKNYVCKTPQVPYAKTTMEPGEDNTNVTQLIPKDTGTKTTKANPGNPKQPYLLPQTGTKSNPDKRNSGSLTAGQGIGIFIGIALICALVGAGIYVFRRIQRSATYSTDRQGFSNALYHKSVDNVSYSDDNGSISSHSKIVKGGTH